MDFGGLAGAVHFFFQKGKSKKFFFGESIEKVLIKKLDEGFLEIRFRSGVMPKKRA